MGDLERLVAIEAIKFLKARYFRFVDTQAWDEFRALFAADATLFFPENVQQPVTVEAFMQSIPAALAGGVTIHRGYMPEIEIRSEDSAHAIWAMEDHLFFPPGVPGIANAGEIHGAGHYRETYVRRNGNWVIQTLELTRLRLEVVAKPRSVTIA
jgi:hypothetical protein